jgi:hypothetical protein
MHMALTEHTRTSVHCEHTHGTLCAHARHSLHIPTWHTNCKPRGMRMFECALLCHKPTTIADQQRRCCLQGRDCPSRSHVHPQPLRMTAGGTRGGQPGRRRCFPGGTHRYLSHGRQFVHWYGCTMFSCVPHAQRDATASLNLCASPHKHVRHK